MNSKFIKNVLRVMLANFISLLGSFSCGFLLPKIFLIDDYGYYKIFSLYLTYTGMMHLGFLDGLLLKYSGIDYNAIDRYKFRTFTKFFTLFQLILSILILCISPFFNGQYKLIILFLGISMFSINLITYFQFISQATSRFQEFSIVKIGTSFLNFILIIALFLLNRFMNCTINVSYYLIGYVIINWFVLIFYIYQYKDIVFGKSEKFNSIKREIIEFFKSGIILTFSYQIVQLILNLDRQFVSILFTTSEYAIYSFAYSLISMITTIISAISLVLFPTLKQLSNETAINYFSNFIIGINGFVLFCLGGYFPLSKVIQWFLPNYTNSLIYLRILFPGLVFTSSITIIIFTYYKMLNYNLQFFFIGFGILISAFFANYSAWFIYKSPMAISWASILIMIFWYLFSIYFLKKRWNSITYSKNFLFVIISCILFYCISAYHLHWLVATFLYELTFLVIIFLFYKKEIVQFKSKRM